MALEMKVFKEIAAYEPKPMFGLTWRQLGALAVMVFVGGGIFTLVTLWVMGAGADMSTATSVAMWVIWPVLLPAAFWGWWRPKGLKPEKFLSFAVRDLVMEKEVVYGKADAGTGSEVGSSVARRGRDRSQAKARKRQVQALRKSITEHE